LERGAPCSPLRSTKKSPHRFVVTRQEVVYRFKHKAEIEIEIRKDIYKTGFYLSWSVRPPQPNDCLARQLQTRNHEVVFLYSSGAQGSSGAGARRRFMRF